MTKTAEATMKRMRRAAKAMGGDGLVGSVGRFVDWSLDWLAKECGDVHLQMTQGDGWQVATCHAQNGWEGWILGRRKEDALAKAVLAVAKKRKTKQ